MSEVTLTVNGTEVTLDVEPRLTLVDALRHRLGLTGSHVGCEHGVCGACTVLVDGAAVRSCLMFCVQASGSEVTTVEALGEIEDLHPLQEAFRRHHGLQCGFCTPGFLMSSYELLRDRNGNGRLNEGHLRDELSGVLCRCTGYAGIVAAVTEVAEAHPDGVPGPKALGRPLNVRQWTPPPGEREALSAAAGHGPAQAAPAAGSGPVNVPVPEGEPNETIEVTTEISPSPVQTWELLSDFMRMTRCMPGVALDTEHGEDTYSGHVGVNLGPMRLSFAGAARVLERDENEHRLRAVAAGRDVSGSGVQADVTVSAQAAGDGTALKAAAKLYLSGRAAQFGRSLAGDVSRGLFEEFGACVERTLTTGEEATPQQLSGLTVTRRLFAARLKALLRRLKLLR
jgi:aerobic-type carbon monoxide dehydrogenase small subunit (CoxS/CutS family)/carbon monoxide dehydrogenase subunit G